MSKSHSFLALSLAAVLAFSGQAFAHAHLTTSDPADKSVVAGSPASLELHFSEELNIRFSGAQITGAGMTEIKAGEATLADEGKTLTVPIPTTLDAGTYSVEWHVLSTDGHKTNGRYSFTVKP
ncbi:copper homeostasis periplasmic binding protein CopC [Rhizobium sp. 18055]|uniref:copper homeostasis periplasmic binding protein CopC n=1 Tax=Rhizobium sp. 18055 TaxID=2681403 RepID=UPI00135A3B27|nr:copper homeostasis periplasmic binding protein CopC [Rhizobium sp. 18055]